MLSRVTPRFLVPAVTVLAVIGLLGCTAPETEPEVDAAVVTTQPDEGTTVIAHADAAERAVETSRTLFRSAPAVVVAPVGDDEASGLAARTGVALGLPVLLVPAADSADTDAPAPSNEPVESVVEGEVDRLGAVSVIAVGDVDQRALGDVAAIDGGDEESLEESVGREIPDGGDGSVAEVAALPSPDRTPATGSTADVELDPVPMPAKPLDSTVALASDAATDLAPVATARAAGVPVTVLPAGSPDPQVSSAAIGALHEAAATRTLLLGEAFAALPDPDWSVRAAASGRELPGGGQHLFGDRLFVALYGAPDAPVLGVLGEQDVTATIGRAKKVAASYETLTDRTVVPTLEVIATVAAGAEGDDGNYSNELPAERLGPYIDAAAEAGVYVVIDLQPGRTDFLTQAKLYESLLVKPNVGLALDPEWRLEPDEKHLTQIGSVTAGEVNSVAEWLAALVDREGLPPKMLVLHQFRLDMIQDRQALDMSHPQLELLIHADGQGGQPDKQATWRALHQDAPAGMAWGWKNFYDEDLPMLSPEQTLRDVAPEPDLVTYQ